MVSCWLICSGFGSNSKLNWANFWYGRSPCSFLPLSFSLHFLLFPPVFLDVHLHAYAFENVHLALDACVYSRAKLVTTLACSHIHTPTNLYSSTCREQLWATSHTPCACTRILHHPYKILTQLSKSTILHPYFAQTRAQHTNMFTRPT
jgi:hypothetical protein